MKLFAAAAILAVGGCYDELPSARISNNTDGPLRIVIRPGGDGEYAIDLLAGKVSRRIGAYGAERGFLLIGSGCIHRYVFPRMGVNFPFEAHGYTYPVMAQVEPDFSIHLLPQTARAVAQAAVFDDRPERGFPLRPVSSACGVATS